MRLTKTERRTIPTALALSPEERMFLKYLWGHRPACGTKLDQAILERMLVLSYVGEKPQSGMCVRPIHLTALGKLALAAADQAAK